MEGKIAQRRMSRKAYPVPFSIIHEIIGKSNQNFEEVFYMKYLKAKDTNGFFPVAIIAEQILDPQYVETKEGKRALTAEERMIILIEESLRQFGKKLTPEDVCRSLNMDFLTAETILDNMVELGIFEHSKGVKR